MKKYWLRWGLIALSINIFLSFLGVVIGFYAHDISDAYGSFAEKIFDFFATILLYTPLGGEGFQFPELFLISFGSWFLVGVLLGFVYGKFRK